MVAFDLRGCGLSQVTPPGSYGLESHVTDVLGVADAVGADEFDIAGWSLGALIVMTAALRDGARLRSVILIDHAGPSQAAALVPVREGLARLDLVTATPEDYLRKVRRAGVVDPWSPFWDAFYTYDLAAARRRLVESADLTRRGGGGLRPSRGRATGAITGVR